MASETRSGKYKKVTSKNSSKQIPKKVTKKKNQKKVPKKVVKKPVAKKKKVRIKYKNLLIFLIVVMIAVLGIVKLFKLPITNIYVSNNNYFTDQEIIEMANLQNYPSSMESISVIIENKLKKNELIKNVKVKKILFRKLYIKIEENTPLFFNSNNNKTVLLDKSESDILYEAPTLINYVPDTIYDEFVKQMGQINISVLKRISEIKYNPNDVDDQRFLLLMEDGNYTYLTLNKFTSINDYIDIIKKFDNKKGVLYLDSGEYFKVFEN